jgi:hypothetical protein
VVVYGNSYTCGLMFYNSQGDRILKIGQEKDRKREFKLKKGQYFIGGKVLAGKNYVYDFEPRILTIPQNLHKLRKGVTEVTATKGKKVTMMTGIFEDAMRLVVDDLDY